MNIPKTNHLKSIKSLIKLLFLMVAVVIFFIGCNQKPDKKNDDINEKGMIEMNTRIYQGRVDSLNKVITELKEKIITDTVFGTQRDSLISNFKEVITSYKKLIKELSEINPSGANAKGLIDILLPEAIL